ncbi:MAG: cytidylate kinase family protein, partial [Myxococcota bacterium]
QHPSERLDRWLARLNSEAHQALRAPLPNIAVSSVAGCAGGEALAAALAHRVAFEAWDRPLLETLAADDTTRQRIFDTLDDAQRAWCDSALRRTRTPTSDLLRVALAIAAHGGAILLEMGAHLLLPPDSERDPDTAAFRRGALRVRLNPTPSMLIPHHAERHAMDEEQARQDLDTMAQDLERFAQKTYGKPLNDPAHHDLLLNSHTLTLFNAVEICVRAYEAKFALDAGWSFVGRG